MRKHLETSCWICKCLQNQLPRDTFSAGWAGPMTKHQYVAPWVQKRSIFHSGKLVLLMVIDEQAGFEVMWWGLLSNPTDEICFVLTQLTGLQTEMSPESTQTFLYVIVVWDTTFSVMCNSPIKELCWWLPVLGSSVYSQWRVIWTSIHL